MKWSRTFGVKPASTRMLSELWGFEFERRLKPLENTLDAFAFRTRLLCAAKVMSTCQHASLLRLQPHYVYILGSSKGAVTTALQAHSRRQRLIGVKKARFTPSPLQPCLTRCHSPGVVPLPKQKRYLFFLLFCLALLDQRRGYNRVRKSQRTWL